MQGNGEVLLQVKDLKTYFHTPDGAVKAVDGVSFDLHRGESLAIVGESGCGKTVTALSILNLVPDPPGKIEGGEVIFEGQNLLEMDDKGLRQVRGNRIGMIFQDPMTSLNPVFSIGNQISESVRIHQDLSRQEAKARGIQLLEMVEIPDAAKRYKMYPHEFSGGMRQRAMIAMALSCDPMMLIADEPSTALDVTIQAQIRLEPDAFRAPPRREKRTPADHRRFATQPHRAAPGMQFLAPLPLRGGAVQRAGAPAGGGGAGPPFRLPFRHGFREPW
jgi:ABC-type dipeptide/oligopeptide/nickel transport system ATPase component